MINDLIFLRHSKLILPYRDHGDMPFSVLADLGTGVLNPPIDPEETQKRISNLSNKIAFSAVRSITASPSQRCQDTSRALLQTVEATGSTPEVATDIRLKEIEFDLMALNTKTPVENSFQSKGIEAVNTVVFTAMVMGACESAEDAYARVSTFFSDIPQDEELRVFLTHDFFLRVVEIFIRRNGAPYYPITLEELENTQRNGYLCGFSTSRSLAHISPTQSA